MMNTSGTCCMVCGCVEVTRERGFFYCVECQVQREEFCDEVFDEGPADDVLEVVDTLNETHEPLIGEGKRKRKKIVKEKERGAVFTSWEFYNFILRGQVEELINLGAPSSIRMTVLQLWAHYLSILEVAFVSKDENMLPKLGKRTKKRDAKLLYGVKKKTIKKDKPEKSVALDSTLFTKEDWSSVQIKKRIQRKLKKHLMIKESQLSIMSTLGCTSCITEDTFSNIYETQNIPTNEFEEDDPTVVADVSGSLHSWIKKEKHFPNALSAITITRERLLILLYIALLYEGSDIQLSDLIRWIREGHISYFEIGHLIPENCLMDTSFRSFIKDETDLPPYQRVHEVSSCLIRLLEVTEWQAPDVSKLTEKYVKELHLPSQFCNLIQQVFHLVPELFSCDNESDIPNYEGRILAVLIILMKLLLGLDGKTEHKISEAALKINKLVAKNIPKQRKKLFVWSDWVKKILCRDAVIMKHHFPTQHTVNPEMLGSPESFISFWRKRSEYIALQNSKIIWKQPSLAESQPALINFFKNILDKLDNPDYMKKEDIDFPPCTLPYHTYIKKILEKCDETEDFISSDAKIILNEDFSKHDIRYLISPGWLNKLASKMNHNLIRMAKSAQKKFSTFKDRRKKLDVKFSKNHCNIAILHDTGRRGKALAPGVQFIDHYEVKKTQTKNNIDKLLRLAVSSMNNDKRKKKKSSVKKTAKKKKEKGKEKEAKNIKLLIPHGQYWILHPDMDEVRLEQFNTQIFTKFPFSFAWLLKECAVISEMNSLVLYKEVVYMEQYLKKRLLEAEASVPNV